MASVVHPNRLQEALRLIRDLPPLSPLVRHLLTTLYTPADEIPPTQVAVWIEKDALTAGKVLALANSAYYGRTEPILTIRHAVTYLGLNAIRNLVISMSTSTFWNRLPTPPEWSTSRFNAHSIAVAVLADMISSTINAKHGQSAFLAGLFHDIGQVGIAALLRDDPFNFKKLNVTEHDQLEQIETELVGFPHSELSAAVVRSWNLPQPIEQAVRFHEVALDHDRINSGDVALSDIVHVADCYADCKGLTISGLPGRNEDKLPSLDQLGIEHKIFTQFNAELDTLLNVI